MKSLAIVLSSLLAVHATGEESNARSTECRATGANQHCRDGLLIPRFTQVIRSSGPIFVGGVKQFSVASTAVEAHLRNKFADFVLFLSIVCRRFNNRGWVFL